MGVGTRGVKARWHKRRENRARGAVLVEFALVAMILITLVFGTIEYGWTFLQYLDVRHGAREVGRLAAVNYDGANTTGAAQTTVIVNEICSRLDTKSGVTIILSRADGPDTPSGTDDDRGVGDTIVVSVRRNPTELTGFFPAIGTVTSDVRLRAEQKISWDANNPSGQTCV